MTYIDGFVIPVASDAKQAFLDHANHIDAHFIEHGALRVVECWPDDVPEGKLTDFRKAVAAEDGEIAAFSWVEWPDKATRDTAMKVFSEDAAMMAIPMPFDGKRMVFGGFAPIVNESAAGTAGYVDGFVCPVTPANRDAYLAMAEKAAAKFLAVGALRDCETWGHDVPEGKVTDFRRSVLAEAGEQVVFSWIEWPDKATRDAGWAKVMADETMKPEEMPFDGKRMFWGGFVPVVQLGE